MTDFTREQLARITQKFSAVGEYYTDDERNLAAFALTTMAERDEARRELAEAEKAIRLLAPMHCEDCGGTGDLWHGPPDDPQQIQCSTCRASGTVSSKYANDPQVLTHPAVRRALGRKP